MQSKLSEGSISTSAAMHTMQTINESPQAVRLLIIIPAFNEEASIGRVIVQVYEAVPAADIVVINDGSTDATALIAEKCGAVVLNLPHNLGIGSAMQTGFMYARNNQYDIAIQVDGDGQHDPQEIPEIVGRLVSSDADVVIGSRYIEDRGYITPWQRRMGIIILSAIISFIVRKHITDPTSGFRALNRRAIHFCAHDYPFDYPEPESVVLFKQAGLKVHEIPVTMNPRYGGQSSITPLRSGYYMVKVILAILIGLLREVPPTVEEEHATTSDSP
jgi:glycosyltransferase involved in cell wall biosynthesis